MPTVGIYALDQDPERTSSLGIFYHTRNLLAALARRPPPGFQVRVFLSAHNAAALSPPAWPAWMSARRVPGGYGTGTRRLWADHVLATRLARHEQVSVLHFPKGFLPWRPPRGVRLIATVHDTINEYYRTRYASGTRQRLKQAYFHWLTLHTLRHADCVLTVSAFSRSELIKLAPSAAGRIEVVLTGPGIPTVAPDPGAPREGILVIGSHLPHKATAETLRLLGVYAARHHARLNVTVAGLAHWPSSWPPLPTEVAVRFMGRLAGEALARLMRRSRVLVLLSEIEGFGMPAVESFALGTPVCYRRATALAEVLDGVPGGWDGTDADSFCRALDEALALSATDIATIRERLTATYNWDQTAAQMVGIYARELAAAGVARGAALVAPSRSAPA